MQHTRKMPIISAALLVMALGTTGAAAQSGIDAVVKTLRDQGYRNVEVEREGNRIKVEARRNGEERELVYDARNGKLMSDENRARSGGGLAGLFGANPDRNRTTAEDDKNEYDDNSGRGRSGDDDDDNRGRGGNDDDDDDDSGRGGSDDDDDDDNSGRGGNDDDDDDNSGRGGNDDDDDDDDDSGNDDDDDGDDD